MWSAVLLEAAIRTEGDAEVVRGLLYDVLNENSSDLACSRPFYATKCGAH